MSNPKAGSVMAANTKSEQVVGTSLSLLRAIDSVFPLGFDLAANSENHIMKRLHGRDERNLYFDENQDSLKQCWHKIKMPDYCYAFLNPPFKGEEMPCVKTKTGEYNCKKQICKKRGYHIDVRLPGVSDWMMQAFRESKKGFKMISLQINSPSNRWFKILKRHTLILDLEHREVFEGHTSSYPKELSLAIWGCGIVGHGYFNQFYRRQGNPL